MWMPVWVPSRYHAGLQPQPHISQVPPPTQELQLLEASPPHQSTQQQRWRLRNARLELERPSKPTRRPALRLKNAKWQPPKLGVSTTPACADEGDSSVWSLSPLHGDDWWESFRLVADSMPLEAIEESGKEELPEDDSDDETRSNSEVQSTADYLPELCTDCESCCSDALSVSEEPAGTEDTKVTSKVSSVNFDGSWSGRGVIRDGMLTWHDGPTVPLVVLSSTALQVALDGRTYQGELRKDGGLHWDDGDVWTRSSWFEGAWSNRGVISGHTLTWTHGQEATTTAPLTITGYRKLQMDFEGRSHSGELREDGRLHWDDGDIWTRQQLEVGCTIKARPGHQLSHLGSEIFRAGDKGTVAKVHDETSSGQKLFDVCWQRTGQSSTYFLDSWTRAFEAESQNSGFGFSLFSEVRHRHRPALRFGVVVGFTQSEVEVKFAQDILRCTSASLQQRLAVAAAAAREETPPSVRPRLDPLPAAVKEVATTAAAPAAPSASARAQSRRQEAEQRKPERPRAGSNLLTVQIKARVAEKAERKPQPPKTGSLAKTPPEALPTEGGAAAADKEAADAKERFEGVVKWSRGCMAWIECAALAWKYSGRDVFLHKNDCLGNVLPKQWENVSFELTLDDQGNPKALRARAATEANVEEQPAPVVIDARDVFRERELRRQARLRPMARTASES
jgi:hypothetical protein